MEDSTFLISLQYFYELHIEGKAARYLANKVFKKTDIKSFEHSVALDVFIRDRGPGFWSIYYDLYPAILYDNYCTESRKPLRYCNLTLREMVHLIIKAIWF